MAAAEQEAPLEQEPGSCQSFANVVDDADSPTAEEQAESPSPMQAIEPPIEAVPATYVEPVEEPCEDLPASRLNTTGGDEDESIES